MAAPWADFIRELPRQEIRDSLDQIRNPFEMAFHHNKNSFNFSASLRTGNAFLCGGYHRIEIEQTYDKAAMTAKRFENHLVNIWRSTEDFLEGTKGRNIVGIEKRFGLDSKDIRDFEWPENPIMLFGNEDSGLPDDLLDKCCAVIHIPSNGLVHSLNVANAAAIATYDIYVKRKWI